MTSSTEIEYSCPEKLAFQLGTKTNMQILEYAKREYEKLVVESLQKTRHSLTVSCKRALDSLEQIESDLARYRQDRRAVVARSLGYGYTCDTCREYPTSDHPSPPCRYIFGPEPIWSTPRLEKPLDE